MKEFFNKLFPYLLVGLIVYQFATVGLPGVPGIDVLPFNPPPMEGKGVLIVEETKQRGNMPKEQLSILTGMNVRKALDANFGAGNYRIWDKDVDATAEDPRWQEALKRATEKAQESGWSPSDPEGIFPPQILISNGRTGTIEALPGSESEAIQLLDKFKE